MQSFASRLFSVFLIPLAWLYWLVVRSRSLAYTAGLLKARRLPLPVISVGNLSVGGTGKTPIVGYIARKMVEAGYIPAVLTRGFGSACKMQPLIFRGADKSLPPFDEAGDEPLMLARQVPEAYICVFPDRRKSALEIADRADFFILDDGLQRFNILKDLELVLIDAARGFGNGRLLPAGFLRLPPNELKRADAVILTKVNKEPPPDILQKIDNIKPCVSVFTHRHRISHYVSFNGSINFNPSQLKGKKAILLSAIAQPATFQESVEKSGLIVAGRIDLRDHSHINSDSLSKASVKLKEAAADLIIVTEKDWVKMNKLDAVPDFCVTACLESTLDSGFDDLLSKFIVSNADAKTL